MTDENNDDPFIDEFMDELSVDARRLATDISPEYDLWPGIASAIAKAKEKPIARHWTPMFAQAAAVVLLVAASSALTYTLTAKDPPQVIVNGSPNLLFEQASFGNRYSLGPGFQDARSSLLDELDAELERLSPEARADIGANLKLIQDAINEMNDALEAEPDNTRLQERLLRTYREELALLRRVSGLSRNVMMRNDV